MHGTRVSRASTYTDSNRQQRQRSGSQTNLSEMVDRRQTYGALRRSSSVSSLRTPRRTQFTSSRSPGNRTPSTVTGVTSNSEQYRRLATENTNKVMEVIQSNRSFFSRLNLGNGGLKTMTSNNFIEIISFFMIKVAGKNLLSKSRPNNHDDVIMSFIQTLNYPYVVNKACFKTPNAHQYFPEVIAILAFLSDLVCDIRKYAAPTDMPLTFCDRLINSEFTHLFSAETLRNYLSYDPDRDSLLDNEGETKLINGLIAIKMKTNGITVEELALRANKLHELSEQLRENLIETDADKYFVNIEERFLEQKTELKKLQDIVAEKRKYLKMVKLIYDERVVKLTAQQVAFEQMTQKIQQQKYSVHDVKHLMAQEISIKNSIVMIQNEKKTIEMDAADAQVKLARLHKLKLDMIKKFNDFTFRITQRLVQCTAFKCLDVNDLTIDPMDSSQIIKTKCKCLSQLKEQCSMITQQHSEQIQTNQNQIIQFKEELQHLQRQYSDQMIKFKNANDNFHLLNQKYTNFECNTNTNKLMCEIDEKRLVKEKLIQETETLKLKVKDLEIKNIELLENGEKQAHEIIRAKQAACNQIDELNDFINKEMENY